jgi:hypothetical protein
VGEAQLLSVLEAAVGVPIARVVGEAPCIGDDSRAEACLHTFRYLTADEGHGDVTLFVKRCVWKQRPESVAYRYLADQGVPTPHLYGALHNRAGEEIVFLEPLTVIGLRRASEPEWRDMLSLLARFNAGAITPDSAQHLHRYEQVGRIDGDLWITGLGANPEDGEIEASLRRCGVAERELPALQQAARAIFAEVAAQPQGLLHQDFLPDNFGRRSESDEMVVFDLHKNAWGPRFADVAPYLAVPDWSDDTKFLDGPERRRESLSRHYLDAYARFGGNRVSLATFRQETTALFWAHKISVLLWLVERDCPDRIQQILDLLRERR